MRLWLSVSSLLAVLAYGGYNFVYENGEIFMNQPLSSNHNHLAGKCAKCHTPWEGIKSGTCKECHSNRNHIKEAKTKKEGECSFCHKEHGGVQKDLTFVKDENCGSCHGGGASKVWKHDKEVKSAREGILLSHRTFFSRGAYKEKICAVCHKQQAFSMAKDGATKARLEVMVRHLKKPNIVCSDCHLKIVAKGFSAKGGGADPAKCVGCHEKSGINVGCKKCHTYHNQKTGQLAGLTVPHY